MSAERSTDGPVVLVAAVGRAEGSRAAAAALACAAADVGLTALLVDLGGKPPRPTLVASEESRKLEERLVACLPGTRVAARGQVCHLAAPADPEGIAAAAAAVTVARGAVGVLHVPAASLQAVLDAGGGPRASAVLLRADLAEDRALVALAARDLIRRGLGVAVLKEPLGWVASRRALFGVLSAGGPGALPPRILRCIAMSHTCYSGPDDSAPDSARATQPERRDHASTRPW